MPNNNQDPTLTGAEILAVIEANPPVIAAIPPVITASQPGIAAGPKKKPAVAAKRAIRKQPLIAENVV